MKHKKLLMNIAKLWAKESYCRRKKVGAIITKNDRILSHGYNGTISGHTNLCEEYTTFKKNEEIENEIKCWQCSGTGIESVRLSPFTFQEVCNTCNGIGYLKVLDVTNTFTVHAEANAILFAARNGYSLEGSEMFVTLAPCPECAKMIVQSGIKKVYYNEMYKSDAGIKFLKKCNIDVEKI